MLFKEAKTNGIVGKWPRPDWAEGDDASNSKCKPIGEDAPVCKIYGNGCIVPVAPGTGSKIICEPIFIGDDCVRP